MAQSVAQLQPCPHESRLNRSLAEIQDFRRLLCRESFYVS